MAEKKNTKDGKSPELQGSNKEKDKKNIPGLVYSLLTIIIALLIIGAVFAGAFYYIVNNNIQGVGEKYRGVIQGIPILKHALPPLPEGEDPDDPKYLTYTELIEKYNELRLENKQLQGGINEIQKNMDLLEDEEYEKYKGEEKNQQVLEDIKKQLQQIEDVKKQVDEERAQLQKDIETFKELIGKGDSKAFKEYYQKIDPQTAQKLYEEILKGEKAEKQLREFVSRYEQMDSSDAAKILEKLGESDMELLVEIVRTMNTDAAAEVVQNMTTNFAAELTQLIADDIKGELNN